MCLYLYLYNINVFILLRSSIIVYHQTIHYKAIQNELSNTKTEIHLYRLARVRLGRLRGIVELLTGIYAYCDIIKIIKKRLSLVIDILL